jgi:hypothetical protein
MVLFLSLSCESPHHAASTARQSHRRPDRVNNPSTANFNQDSGLGILKRRAAERREDAAQRQGKILVDAIRRIATRAKVAGCAKGEDAMVMSGITRLAWRKERHRWHWASGKNYRLHRETGSSHVLQ